MNCIELERALQEQLDQRAPPDCSEWETHLAQCESCRSLRERYVTLHEATLAWRRLVPAVNLAAAVLTDLESETPRSRTAAPRPEPSTPATVRRVATRLHLSRSILTLAMGGLAAAVLAASTPLPGPHPTASHPTAVHRTGTLPGRGLELAALDSAPPLQNLILSAQAAYSSLAVETAGALEEAALFWPSRPGWHPPTRDAERPLLPNGEEFIDGVRRELQPLESGLGTALDFLWSRLPDTPAT